MRFRMKSSDRECIARHDQSMHCNIVTPRGHLAGNACGANIKEAQRETCDSNISCSVARSRFMAWTTT